MHIVKVNGGLGNQMFQYAFALVLDARYGDARLDLGWIESYGAHNGYELDRLFDVRVSRCAGDERRSIGDVEDTAVGKMRRRLRLTKRTHYAQVGVGFDSRAIERVGPTYFAGYWQSHKYYAGNERLVREAFAFKTPQNPENTDFLSSINGSYCIGVHVRRGDALSYPAMAGVCGENYYKAAIAAASTRSRDYNREPILAFFSDDLDWCRDRLSSLGESVYVDWNRGEDSHADLRLMSQCDALVIANSSFSWWGAWLGAPGRAIYAPIPWVAPRYRDNLDIAPIEWTRVAAAT